MKGHVAFVALTEIRDGVFGPLVGFRQQHAVAEPPIDFLAQRAQQFVRFREVFTVRAVALVKIRHSVQTHSVHAQPQPEIHHLRNVSPYFGAVEIQIGLMAVKPMPVVCVRDRIPRPVRGFEILEDDPRFFVLVCSIAPHVKVAPDAVRLRPSRSLKPGVLVGRVIDDQLGDHANPALVRGPEKCFEVGKRAIRGVHADVIRNVVSVVFERRRIKRQQPHRGNAEILKVIQPLGQPFKIPDSIGVAVGERPDVKLVNDGVFVPQRIVFEYEAHSTLKMCAGASCGRSST